MVSGRVARPFVAVQARRDKIFDARGKMYLHTGWEKFARYHHLQAGFVLSFSYLGEADMSVKVFDETRCRRHYHGDSDEED
ncbi:hypothetical protein QYE76_027836 [Lolium multiflorum]|uniref:TF-B3 domain-containing protein n=1 Tax=Lolium multiflorum TaxID=4521 RepID=A0AAD8QJV0_LOLMU|nr:hypothetical protein QYE76_027836 [Lolium multiflorum]